MKTAMKKSLVLLLVAALVCSMGIIAFADSEVGMANPFYPRPHDNITVVVTSNQSMLYGKTMDVYCQVFGLVPEDTVTGNAAYEWNLSNKAVLEFEEILTDHQDVVTVKAVGVGTCIVGCRVTANYYETGEVVTDSSYTTITVEDDGHITVSPWTKNLTVGEGFTLTVDNVPRGANVYFYSDNDYIASVDQFGYISANNPGTVNVWAECNGYKDSCSVHVDGAMNVITALTPASQTRNVAVGTTEKQVKNSFETIYGFYRDSYGSSGYVPCDVTWSCSNFNPNKAGTYYFTGRAYAPSGYTMSTSDTVTAIVTVTGSYKLTLGIVKSTFSVGEAVLLTATVQDGNGKVVSSIDGKSIVVNFNATNSSVKLSSKTATVNANGVATTYVTGVFAGTSTISAEVWNASGSIVGNVQPVTITGTNPLPFIDVRTSDWFYSDIANAYNMGLINGKTANKFMPNDNMTYAEAIKLAACMHQYYYNGKVTLANGYPNWYSTYVEYAKNNQIPCAYTNLNANITRSDYVHIFYHALPASTYTSVNSIKAVPDMTASASNYDEVLTFYNAGILSGSDNYGNFNPNSAIKRCEVATIISRMMDAKNRKTFSLGN